jgi:hypothetical protein
LIKKGSKHTNEFVIETIVKGFKPDTTGENKKLAKLFSKEQFVPHLLDALGNEGRDNKNAFSTPQLHSLSKIMRSLPEEVTSKLSGSQTATMKRFIYGSVLSGGERP